MPSLVLKNFFRFSSLAVVSAVSIMGGPNLALSYPINTTSSSFTSIDESDNENSLKSNVTSSLENPNQFSSESDSQLVTSSKFYGVSSSIGNASDFNENTLSDSSSVNSSNSYSTNTNSGSYYWYRRNKNKNIPATVKAAFSKSSLSSSEYEETFYDFDNSNNTVSNTLNSSFSTSSSLGSRKLGSSISATSEANSLDAFSSRESSNSSLTNSFSQSF